MTTPDITIKINSDEKGAVAGLRRLRSEVLNNEKGLKSLASEGKMTGKSLKDVAGVLGPEFQVLGDRIDHITGALGNVKGAGLAAKASMAALVSVGAFQVGQMIGNWVFETEKWKEALSAARQEADRLNNALLAAKKEQAAILTAEELAQEAKGAKSQINELGDQISKLRKEAEAWTLANVTGFGVNDRKEEIATLEQERAAARATVQAYADATKQREKAAEVEAERHIAKMIAEETAARERAIEASRQLAQTQEDYLFGLEAELVKLRDGERAYTLMTLAKKGFTYETAQQALALQDEIAALREQGKAAKESGDALSAMSGARATIPGQVQATESRGLTRGIGTRGQDKILAATQEQAKRTQELLAESKRQTQILDQRMPRGSF
jgi:hypothetical protein